MALTTITTRFVTKTLELLDENNLLTSLEEAERILNVAIKVKGLKQTKKTKKENPELPKTKLIPFCGVIRDDWCMATRKHHGLYSQCTMPKKSPGDLFCPTCLRQSMENDNGKPSSGLIQERKEQGDLWSAPNGDRPKKLVTVLNFLKKHDQKQLIIDETMKFFGVEIPESEWTTLGKKSRARKIKSAVVDSSGSSDSETDNDASEQAPKKPRGRPPKSNKSDSDNDAKEQAPKKRRGRPPKSTKSDKSDKSDNDNDDKEQTPKKRRGRPSKKDALIKKGEDIIANLAAAAAELAGKNEKETTPEPETATATEPEPEAEPETKESTEVENDDKVDVMSEDNYEAETDEENETELDVTIEKIDGKNYLLDQDNNLYDYEAYEQQGDVCIIGKYDPKTKKAIIE